MSKQEAGKSSPKSLALIWLAVLVSLAVAVGVGWFLTGDLIAFRSCGHNNTGLSISNCGKQGLNVSDILVILVFIAAVSVTLSLIGRAWKMSRRR